MTKKDIAGLLELVAKKAKEVEESRCKPEIKALAVAVGLFAEIARDLDARLQAVEERLGIQRG